MNVEVSTFGFTQPAVEKAAGDVGQIEVVTPLGSCLSLSQREKGVDEPFLLHLRSQHTVMGGSQRFDGGFGIGKGDLDKGFLASKGRSQLMGGVGNEAALGDKGPLQSPEEPIKGVGQLFELVVRTLEGEALVQVGRRDVAGGGCDTSKGTQDATSDDPTERDRQDGHGGEGDPRLDEQLVELCRVLMERLGLDLLGVETWRRQGVETGGPCDIGDGWRSRQLAGRDAGHTARGAVLALENESGCRVNDEEIRNREQSGTGDEKKAAVHQCEAKANGTAR
jgi:hypothetical protein